jgi:NitT/TauT family transport system substrate-binding protein
VATLKGWQYAAENREYTLDLVVQKMDEAHLPNNKAHQRWMLDKIIALISPGNKNVLSGQLLDSDFTRALEILQAGNPAGDINTGLSYDIFHKSMAK